MLENKWMQILNCYPFKFQWMSFSIISDPWFLPNHLLSKMFTVVFFVVFFCFVFFVFCFFVFFCLWLESDWQQVSSGLQDSGRSQHSSGLDGLDFSTSFQLFINSFKAVGNVSSSPTTIDATATFIFHSFLFLQQSLSMFRFSLSFIFSLWSVGTAKSTWPLVVLLFHVFC